MLAVVGNRSRNGLAARQNTQYACKAHEMHLQSPLFAFCYGREPPMTGNTSPVM